jgi:hypothetical protein
VRLATDGNLQARRRQRGRRLIRLALDEAEGCGHVILAGAPPAAADEEYHWRRAEEALLDAVALLRHLARHDEHRALAEAQAADGRQVVLERAPDERRAVGELRLRAAWCRRVDIVAHAQEGCLQERRRPDRWPVWALDLGRAGGRRIAACSIATCSSGTAMLCARVALRHACCVRSSRRAVWPVLLL